MIANADGRGLMHATTDVRDGEPTWSPDGTKLAFIDVAAGRRRLVTANLDGSGLTVLASTLECDVNDPEWSTPQRPSGGRSGSPRIDVRAPSSVYALGASRFSIECFTGA